MVGINNLDTAAVSITMNNHTGSEVNAVAWGMNDNTYIAMEDESDGYRSHLKKIEVHEGQTTHLDGASRINRAVTIKYITADDRYTGELDMIEIVDIENPKHIWLDLGTSNTDDYYPSFVWNWNAMIKTKEEKQTILKDGYSKNKSWGAF